MAEKRVIELEIKTDKANKAINDLNKSTTDLAASFEDVYGEMQPLSGRMGELEDRLYELALAGKQNTQEYKDLQSEVSKFKRVIMETDMAVDGASGTMSQKLSGALGGITSAFELGQGAMMSFGVSSEEVEQALLKVQSAMAISQGFQGIKEAVPSFKALGTAATNAFNNMTTAGKAFAVTGIGLLLTGVGLLIANFDKLKETFSTTSQAQKDLASTMDAYKEGATEAIKQTREVGNAFDLARQGVISKEEALHLYNETLGDSFGKAKNLNEAEKLYADKTDAYIKSTALRAQAQALFAKAAEEQVKGITATFEDQQSGWEKTINVFGDAVGSGLKYVSNGLINIEKDIDKAQGNQYKNAQKRVKQQADNRSKQLNDLAASLLKEAELIENKNKIVSKNEKATNDEITAKKKETADKNKAIRDKALEEEKRLAEERRKFLLEQEELDETRAEQAWQRKQEEQAKMLEEELAMEADARARREQEEAAEELRQEERFKREQERRAKNKQFAIQTAQNTLQLISDISSLFANKSEKDAKRAFEIQKAASIASATIATYQSAVSAYQSQFVPIPDPSSPVRGAIAAGVAIASGLVNIAKISSQKFEGGGSVSATSTPSGGGAGATSNVITPNFNIVGNAQATNPLAGLGNQPIQAYVVSGEVTTAQNLDRNRINYATFG